MYNFIPYCLQVRRSCLVKTRDYSLDRVISRSSFQDHSVGSWSKRRREMACKPHVLVVPYPSQGHINPLLQFSKRLASKGLKVTLALTVFASKSFPTNIGLMKVETISDGFDENGFAQADSVESFLRGLETVGSKTLIDLITKLEHSGDHVSCVVYDAFLPWVFDVAQGYMSLVAVPFFTQSCSVNSIYYHVQRGLIQVPVKDPVVSIPGLPDLEISDLPSFISTHGSYPAFYDLVLKQFANIHQADCILFNTFEKLEPGVVDWMSKLWPILTVGPTVPSLYLDARLEDDRDYVHLVQPCNDKCINWLNTKESKSVVYVSLGSRARLEVEQMEELAQVLRSSKGYFLWVVRAAEKHKLPDKFLKETSEKGLVVTWCSQLEVLSHDAVGCFVTHCGWNSTLETLSLGVPLVAMPQWTDQITNAKFVVDVWRVGLRAKVDEKGITRGTVIEACIREIMQGEKGMEIRRNATWKQLAKEALGEGGTSDKNIEDFVSRLVTNA